MKKLIALVMVMALTLGLSTAVFAEAGNNTHTAMDNETIGVNGQYSGAEDDTVYSVKIEWGEMKFTYQTTGEKTWDPATHTYNVSDEDKWVASGNEVKVTNHSNAAVNVAFSFAKNTETYKGEYTGKMSVDAQLLASGVENKPEEAANVTSALTLEGTLNHVERELVKLGEITVALTAAE